MKKLNQSKIILLIASILLIILGIAILRHSIISTLLSVVFLGSLLTLAGIVEIFRSFKLRSASRIFLDVLEKEGKTESVFLLFQNHN